MDAWLCDVECWVGRFDSYGVPKRRLFWTTNSRTDANRIVIRVGLARSAIAGNGSPDRVEQLQQLEYSVVVPNCHLLVNRIFRQLHQSCFGLVLLGDRPKNHTGSDGDRFDVGLRWWELLQNGCRRITAEREQRVVLMLFVVAPRLWCRLNGRLT